MLIQSKNARADLQDTIQELADKVKEDAQQHRMYTETLIKEIADLKERISEQQNATDELKDQHCSQLASKDKQHAETKTLHERSFDELSKSHAAELKKLNADSKAEKERHAGELR